MAAMATVLDWDLLSSLVQQAAQPIAQTAMRYEQREAQYDDEVIARLVGKMQQHGGKPDAFEIREDGTFIVKGPVRYGPIRTTMPGWNAVVDLGPALIDGLTETECLECYQTDQGHDLGGLVRPLTARQREAASAAWSAQLRTKVDATERKDREQVLVDNSWWDD